MGRSWDDVMKSLLVTIAQLIIKMTVLKDLQNSAFGHTGFGSFIGSLLGGFSGYHAGGGFLAPGQWGIAGENGPEAIFAGSAGLSVVPASASGGRIQIFDMRGSIVTDDVVRRAEMQGAMVQTHARAVADARAAVTEDYSRGRTPWR